MKEFFGSLEAQIKIAEGKTKIIWSTENPQLVIIESKDNITAGDGAKRSVIGGKAQLATETTANCFRLLNKEGIPTHFIATISETAFVARRAQMVPIESVARRVATGSFLKRNPSIPEGFVFDDLKLEFFHKDDANHDPLIEFSNDHWLIYDAKLPKKQAYLRSEAGSWLQIDINDINTMRVLTRKVFLILEKAWANQGVTLVDLKIEFGKDTDGNLVVADVIDNDSWRIWPGGDKAAMLDKQRYRNIERPTPEELESIRSDYQKVAEMTRSFLAN